MTLSEEEDMAKLDEMICSVHIPEDLQGGGSLDGTPTSKPVVPKSETEATSAAPRCVSDAAGMQLSRTITVTQDHSKTKKDCAPASRCPGDIIDRQELTRAGESPLQEQDIKDTKNGQVVPPNNPPAEEMPSHENEAQTADPMVSHLHPGALALLADEEDGEEIVPVRDSVFISNTHKKAIAGWSFEPAGGGSSAHN
jgi:hypothetical protein